ncbi:sensor histidine kinase [Thalassotalea marina]|uniref:histidine kinase n=1 Tax=Thalassotalea marina TaxID=1673741 RepID=A0A919EM96_9GAMM|nr:ATP-binding protein [Thalassotalea marina]GHF97633.1 two-component sensor histidine kinase [Thalassotalea marina]
MISEDFAELASQGSLQGLSSDIEQSFYIDDTGKVNIDDSEVVLKWGFDALYSNMGYRLIEKESGKEVFRSAPEGVKSALIDKIPLEVAAGFYNLSDPDLNGYRTEIHIQEKAYWLDLAQTKLIGQLANEAILPAVMDSSTFAIAIAFILFLTVNIVAIKLIVKPVKSLSSQVSRIQPENLTQRVTTENLPTEFLPIAKAFNQALEKVEGVFNEQKRFIADAAHELRTPLTVLLSRLQLSLEESKLKQELMTDTKYMARIVEQLLDLSRAQNIAERKSQNVDLLPVIKDVMGMLVPLAMELDHQLEFVNKVPSCVVNVDEGEISVVIKNLIENAIKHCPNETTIVVTLEERQISIEDSGMGIEPALREKVFERFYRADASNLNGSGLGLAITKEILSHYGAKIELMTSESLGGTKCLVTFL